MDAITGLLSTLNTLSPLAVIALLALVLLSQAKNNKAADTQLRTLTTIQGNDLHELPSMAEDLRQIAMSLQRIETTMASNFSTVIARLNGGHR